MKFSGTVDFGAKVTKFDAFLAPHFRVLFVQCHAVFVLAMVAQLRLVVESSPNYKIIAEKFCRLNTSFYCLLGEYRV